MTTAVANSMDPFAAANPAEFSLKRFLIYSLCLHGALAASVIISIVFHFQGNPWGGVGGDAGSVSVKLVGNSSMPMPPPPIISKDSTVVDPTNGLFNEEVKPKPPAPPKESVPIPTHEIEKPPKPIEHPSKIEPRKTPPPPNAVAYGGGGPPPMPTGTLGDKPGATPGGMTVQGQGGGDFATRYGWYIEAVRRKIGSNWQQNTIDPGIRAARVAHCVMTFTIARDGSVRDARIVTTSGNMSMDNSAQRALLSSIPMPGLPPDYSGSYVNVTFDFDLAMTH
ncbi:MAG TPA: energy transducer TonB [Candidatus Acidoferrum sp.]|jgi:protein TonB